MPRHTPVSTRVRGSTVYLRSAPILRPEPKKPPRHLMRWMALIAVLGLLAVGIQNAYPALAGSDFFQLQHIEVTGNDLLPEQDVIDWSALNVGDNLFECDLPTVTQRLEQRPIIKQALLIRQPPETLVITLIERQPIAQISTPDGLRGLDAAGVSFPLPQVRIDLPVVTGLSFTQDSTGAKHIETLPELATFVNELYQKTPVFWREISEIRVHAPNLATVYLVGDGLAVKMRFKDPDRQVQNFQAYAQAAPYLPGDLAYVDLRFRDQVVVGKHCPTK